MIQITWLGHSSWLIESGSHRWLIDPFLTQNPVAKHRPQDFRSGIETILITHGHFDHVADAAEIANSNSACIAANYEIATWFNEKHGVKNTLGMNLGGWGKVPGGRVKLVPAWHSSVLPDGTYGGNPGGFVAEFVGRRIYFAGDTALFSDLQLIGKLNIDVAVLPIGDLFTMGPEDSVQATQWIQPRYVLPTHYDTWPPIAQDAQNWADLIRRDTKSQPVVLAVGETWELAS